MTVSSVATGYDGISLLAGNAAYDPAGFFLIQRVAGTGSSDTITFSSIPQTYKHLQIRANVLTAGSVQLTMNVNGADTNQKYHYVQGTGSAVSASNASSVIYLSGQTVPSSYNMPTAFIVDIHDYASTTKNKTARFISGQDSNAVYYDRIWLGSALKYETTAITSLTFSNNASSNFTTASTFALYGMKG
jgi:hypothetical protein